MIDKQNLQYLKSINRGLLYNFLSTTLTFSNYIIMPQQYEMWQIRKLINIDGNIFKEGIMSDSPDMILNYASELLDKSFNSMLVGGLGLGLVPYVCQGFSDVDVVEIDQEIIDINNTIGHLTNSNLINDDMFQFNPVKNYDIIVLDIWNCENCNNTLSSEISTLVNKYTPFLNQSGFIYIPINKNLGNTIFGNSQ